MNPKGLSPTSKKTVLQKRKNRSKQNIAKRGEKRIKGKHTRRKKNPSTAKELII